MRIPNAKPKMTLGSQRVYLFLPVTSIYLFLPVTSTDCMVLSTSLFQTVSQKGSVKGSTFSF